MPRTSATAMAALAAFAMLIPVLDDAAEAKKRHRGAGIAAGVVLGVAAAAIIANSGSARADSSSHRKWVRRCNRWYNQCMDGNDYSCEKYETRGCTE